METAEKAKVLNLPIFQHFDQTEIATQGKNALDKFRKGEWSIFQILKLAAVGAIGYGAWVYVLPPIFLAIGQTLAAAATAVLVLFLVLLLPVIFKILRRLTRVINKATVRHDPFGELEDQRKQMLLNQEKFRKAKGKIQQLKDDMANESTLSEKNAKDLQQDILKNQAKAERIKAEIEQMKKTGGQAAMGTDEYVQKNADFLKVVSEAQREGHMLEQAQNFVRKYGSRAQVMQKLGQKLTMIDTVTEIKIQDFDATVEILKKDSEFASKSREATNAAKSAMGFGKGWELDYALDVVTNTIAEDIAITTGNLNDINTLTANFDMNSDDMFANLDKLANDIKVGTNVTPDAKQYTNPNYALTQEDKAASGGFGNIFN